MCFDNDIQLFLNDGLNGCNLIDNNLNCNIHRDMASLGRQDSDLETNDVLASTMKASDNSSKLSMASY